MEPKVQLFALPFAGGSKYSYNSFKNKFPGFIDFIPLELPGRGERMVEPLIDSMEAMTNDVFEQIKDRLDKPYAFYGHSMGTLLAYLLTHKIKSMGLPTPLHLIVTGCGGPSSEEKEKERHKLSKSDFKKKLNEYGGSPKEILDNDDLFEFFEPIIRNDFKAVETYEYKKTEPLSTPITVMVGLSEKVTEEETKLWEIETTEHVSIRKFPGGHFFIYDHIHDLVKIISRCIHESTPL